MNYVRGWLIAGVALLITACSSTPEKSSEPVGPVTVGGGWALTTEGQMGAQESVLTLVQNGNILSGTVASQAGSTNVTGSLDDKTVKFNFMVGRLPVSYTGTTDGKTMRGRVSFGPVGEGTFRAKRQ